MGETVSPQAPPREIVPPTERYTVTEHACKICGARVLRNLGTKRYCCGTCGAEGWRVAAICGCGVRLPKGPRRGGRPFVCATLLGPLPGGFPRIGIIHKASGDVVTHTKEPWHPPDSVTVVRRRPVTKKKRKAPNKPQRKATKASRRRAASRGTDDDKRGPRLPRRAERRIITQPSTASLAALADDRAAYRSLARSEAPGAPSVDVGCRASAQTQRRTSSMSGPSGGSSALCCTRCSTPAASLTITYDMVEPTILPRPTMRPC